PLLFEKGPEGRVDKIAVVSAPLEVQRQRVLARSGWDDEKLDRILSRQVSDEEKRRRADFVIDTGKSLDDAREQVKHLIARLILK
uniref:dephospho-CoA kinase n=1 Tax=uncultured Bartonella sp. TaxID=104108 RepID=UPI0025EAC348